MKKTLNIIAIMAIAGAGAVSFAQDDNTPPVITDVTWEIMRNVGGDPVFGPFDTIEAFDPATDIAYELDLIWITVTVVDPDFETEEGEGVYYLRQTEWLPVPGYPAPEPPPIAEDMGAFFPTETGLRPASGDTLTFIDFFQVPSFVGENQAKLRDLIEYDVSWFMYLIVSNEADPSCTQGVGGRIFLPCESAVDLWLEPFFAIQNPILDAPNPPPFADAGADRLVEAGTITLDGSRSIDLYNLGFNVDSDNVFDKDDLTFTWEWLSGPERVDPVQTDEHDPTATVTLNDEGDYIYRLIVDDNVNALPSTDTVTITVGDIPDRNPPQAYIRGPATAVPVGTIITLTSESTDIDDDDLSYFWQQTDELGDQLPPENVREIFQPLGGLNDVSASWQVLIPGTFYFRLLVDDGYFQSSARFTVEVIDTETDGVQATNEGADSNGDSADLSSGTMPAVCGAGVMPFALLPLAFCVARKHRR